MKELLVGRRIWVVVPPTEGFRQEIVYDCRVTGFKQFLAAGPVAMSEPSATDGIRTDHIMQLFTDTGLRTLAAASVRLRDPRKAKK